MKFHQPELLAPAGSLNALTAAVHAGCDAVYLSGQKFGARANAENFTNETLPAAFDFAHLHNVKVYYAANTLVKEGEMSELLEQVRFLYREGIDALIVQDLGVYNLIHQNFPDLHLHASTQMTVHNLNGVEFAQNLGFERVVLSRELSLKDIIHIRKNSTIELECFVHGALCFCYSGQCLMSSLIGGRSGNRGTCAQPCRLPYDLYSQNKKINRPEERHLLSPKDIQTLDILPSLIESGIHSFKIEGRMKNPNYVALMTSLYRKYIDLYLSKPEAYKVDEQDLKDMHQIYNRGGFSNGYYTVDKGRTMMSLSRPNHQGIKIGHVSKIIDTKNVIISLNEQVHQGDCLEINSKSTEHYSFTVQENITAPTYKLYTDTKAMQVQDEVYKLTDVELAGRIGQNILQNPKKLFINLTFNARLGQPMSLLLEHEGLKIEAIGSVVEQAKTSAMTEEKISIQLSKTGNDPISITHIEFNVDESIFISIKEINGLRREVIEKLLEKLIEPTKREDIEVKYNPTKNVNPLVNRELNVLLRNMDQFEVIIKYTIDNVYVEFSNFSIKEINEMASKCKLNGIGFFVALPRIIRDEHNDYLKQQIEHLKKIPIDGVMIRTLDAYELVHDSFPVVLDYTMNIFNNSALDFWLKKGIKKIGVSPELNEREISGLKGAPLEMVVYGYIPLMVTTQCLLKNTGESCKDQQPLLLKDRKNMNFKVYGDCKMCFNTLYNALPVMLLDKYKELKKLDLKSYRVELLDETASEIAAILNFALKMKNKENLSAVDFENTDVLKNYTRGHFARGIV